MVTLAQLRLYARNQLEQDRLTKVISARGDTLEAAVQEAAALLEVPVRRLEYEVTEKGMAGFLGVGKKEWAIQAYEKAVEKKAKITEEAGVETVQETGPVVINTDGAFFVRLLSTGAFLKVTAPQGAGRRVEEAEVTRRLEERAVSSIKADVVAKVVEEAAGTYIKVGSFQHNPMHDSAVSVEVTEDKMKAFISVTPPGLGGCDIPEETIIAFLHKNGVNHGIDEAFLAEFADKPVYRKQVEAARGTPSQDGRDAYIQYNFETDQSKVRLKESNSGQVDFKELNIIQNVVENQPLARKLPPEKGVFGRTVTNVPVAAKDGKDIPLPVGKNVHVADDGATLLADINGQVLVAQGKINVEPVYTVPGDVNLKTGNIVFLGTVVIKGSVMEGFSVKAAGNIEVMGTVERAELDAEGDIIVRQGITGKETNIIRAGRSIWSKFVENASVEVGNMLVATDGILNSKVDAMKRIVCQGKRARIVGGRLRASEEINARIIGNSSGIETVCEVGIDPKNKARLEELTAARADAEQQLKEINKTLPGLIKLRDKGELPEDKEEYMTKLLDRQAEMSAVLESSTEEMNQIKALVDAIAVRGRVSASERIFPGVKVIIRDTVNDLINDYRAVTFVLENNLIRAVKYEEMDAEAKKGPDGSTAD